MVSPRLRWRPPLTATLALACACAQIESSSVVEIMPRPDARPLVLGPPGGEITARGLAVTWAQDTDRLALHIDESRACASVRHVPVVRVERIHRKTAGGAMWWEYGLGAAALAGGLVGLIRPEAFSQATIEDDGVVVKDTATGYRIGGIFTGLGALLLTAAVVDTVRTRDEVLYTDAYRRERGGAVACREPVVPLAAHTVELLVGEWTSAEDTADDGRVRFLLPEVDQLPAEAREAIAAYEAWEAAKAEADAIVEAAEEARAEAEAAEASSKKRRRGRGAKAEPEAEPEPEPIVVPEVGPPPEPFVVRGVLRVDDTRALAVSFVVPYEREAATGHEGAVEIEPGPPVKAPPRPTVRTEGDGASQAADGGETEAEAETMADGGEAAGAGGVEGDAAEVPNADTERASVEKDAVEAPKPSADTEAEPGPDRG